MQNPSARPGEFDLIARYFVPLAAPGALGLTDDAAMLSLPPGCDLVLSKDMLVAGIHFFASDPADAIARKALRVNLSDLAAKGARPLGFLLGLGLPQDWTEAWLAEFARGLGEDAAAYACPLLGGDTVSSPERLTLSVTVFGAVPSGAMTRRSGGQPGDTLYVTGTIGDGALGLIARQAQISNAPAPWPAGDCAALIDRYLVPQPRNALAEIIRTHASAGMDVSDGLIGDATKLAAASGTGLTLQLADVPLSLAARNVIAHQPDLLHRAVTGGDDYEVLCTVPAEKRNDFEREAARIGVPVTCIGELADAREGVQMIDANGQPYITKAGSFRHF